MKILFLGNFEAEFSSENYYLKTLRSMGHDVVTLQENKTNSHKIVTIIHQQQFELFFWVHTHGAAWTIPNMADALRQMKHRGIISFAFHLDLYMGLQRESMLRTDDFFKVEHFFTVDKLMADWLNANTKTKGYYLPAGVYDAECSIQIGKETIGDFPNLTLKYPHEIIFTGSKGYHKEYPYRGQLIEWLHANYGSNFAHYGGGGLPGLRGQELNNLYASAKIVIGDTLCKNFDYPYYFSDRLFEVTGRGGFLIFPHIEGIGEHFEIGKEIVTYQYSNFGELKDKIDYYLTHDEEREAIRLAGHHRTKHEHTYKHRLQIILGILKPIEL